MTDAITIMTPADSAELRKLARTDAALTMSQANDIFRANVEPDHISAVYRAVHAGAIQGDPSLVRIYLDRVLGPVERNINVRTLSINDMIESALFGDDDDGEG
jgi:hypothetical protein